MTGTECAKCLLTLLLNEKKAKTNVPKKETSAIMNARRIRVLKVHTAGDCRPFAHCKSDLKGSRKWIAITKVLVFNFIALH